jgi:predicted dienelactone hydrolase
MLRLSLFVPVALAATLSWHAGQQSFSFEAPAITAALGWESSTITGLIWYPVSASAPEQAQYIGPAGKPNFRAEAVAVGAPLVAQPARLPLILVSHGNGGSSAQMAWLGTALARAGFIAAAIDHPGNTSAGKPTVQGFTEWWFRPPAMSAALDRVLSDPVFGPRIDRDRIGAAGYSRGGFAVVGLAGGQVDLAPFRVFCARYPDDGTCNAPPQIPDIEARVKAMTANDPSYRAGLAAAGAAYADRRIRAIYAIAPSVGESLTLESLRKIAIPSRFVYGTADVTVIPPSNALRIAGAIPNATTLVIPDASHFVFFAACTPAGKVAAARVCTDAATVDRAAVHKQVAEDATAFFESALKR